jgi:hypothetical protein
MQPKKEKKAASKNDYFQQQKPIRIPGNKLRKTLLRRILSVMKHGEESSYVNRSKNTTWIWRRNLNG